MNMIWLLPKKYDFLSLQIENLINTHCGGLFTLLSAI